MYRVPENYVKAITSLKKYSCYVDGFFKRIPSGAGRGTKECRVIYASSRVSHARAVDIKIRRRYII